MTTSVDLYDLLTTKEASVLLGVKRNTLEIWRHKGKGPPFLRLGDGPCAPVRYLRSALTDWLAARSFASTSAYSPAATSTKSNSCRSSNASG